MAISNELSSEIASALFDSKERSSEELALLRNLVLEVHTTLQEMTDGAHADRLNTKSRAKAATSDHSSQ